MDSQQQRKARFSERIGKVAKPELQVESLNNRTRARIVNALNVALDRANRNPSAELHGDLQSMLSLAFADQIMGKTFAAWGDVEAFVLRMDWYRVYDAVEFFAEVDMYEFAKVFRSIVDQAFVEELAPYRFINGILAPQFDAAELQAVQSGLESDDNAVAAHFAAALRLLTQRPEPDYRNSVKESISAVEAACRRISGKPKATLGDALKAIAQSGRIHPAMQEAFGKLYGWTSDASGIRHSMTGDEVAGEKEARFMLVTCCAFVAFLES